MKCSLCLDTGVFRLPDFEGTLVYCGCSQEAKTQEEKARQRDRFERVNKSVDDAWERNR